MKLLQKFKLWWQARTARRMAGKLQPGPAQTPGIGAIYAMERTEQMTKAHQNIITALLPLAINKAVKFAANGGNGFLAGQVVVVTNAGRHGRKVGHPYLLVTDGPAPRSLGRKGTFKKGFENTNDIRAAKGSEIVKALRDLNPAQVKAVLCSVSELEPFSRVLSQSGVLANPEGDCACRD